jgi:hypothetical protein
MSTSCATAAPLRHPPGEAHSPRAVSPLLTAQQLWEGSLTPRTDCPLDLFQSSREIGVGDASHITTFMRRPGSTRRGKGTAARQPTSSPRGLSCHPSVPRSIHGGTATPTHPTGCDFCRQKRVPRQNALRDTIHLASRRRLGVDKTDCARGGQQNRVGPLGQHGRHGPLAKTSPFFTRIDNSAPRIVRKTHLGHQFVTGQLHASLGVSPPTLNTATTSTFCRPERVSRQKGARDRTHRTIRRRGLDAGCRSGLNSKTHQARRPAAHPRKRPTIVYVSIDMSTLASRSERRQFIPARSVTRRNGSPQQAEINAELASMVIPVVKHNAPQKSGTRH